MIRIWKPFAVAITVVSAATAAMLAPHASTMTRSIRRLPMQQQQHVATVSRFDRTQSAALFVGVRRFTKDRTIDVPYAVDDAVDLAYTFALDARVSLVPAERVVLALSGTPQKEESQHRLDELKKAGAQIENADPSDILLLLQQQAAAAGQDGMFILSISSHGFVWEGTPYILGSTSLFRYPDTALSTTRIFDIVATSEARRSLLFIDACRERIASEVRTPGPDPRTAAPLIDRMTQIEGQVVFYAAAPGRYAYDDPKNGNGVFTRAVIEGLHCKAAAAGVVTVDTLRRYVEREVRQWIRAYRDPSIGAAIQVSMEGDTDDMPLAICSQEDLNDAASVPAASTSRPFLLSRR
ncbi:MAG: hypothetical protein DMF56_23605 [Acidobacteria bacterium]|nr:MAG: hypothetical protein DMF56_23605 [Acidobacteriota bacterium]